MATSPHLSLKLREALGPEAGDELIGLVDRAASDISDLRGDLAELRHQMELGFARVDARFAEMQSTMDVRFAEMEKSIGVRFAEIGVRFAEMEKSIGVRFAGIDTQFTGLARQMEKQTNRLILWSFAFWVTTLAALAAVLLKSR